jgi:biotin carboxyl carrier protein
MKMEHPIKAPNAGVVKDLPAQAGIIVQAGSLLAVIEDD